MSNSDSREFAIQKIYTKDISLEAPNTPEIFKEQWQPDINLQLNNNTQRLDENVQEIVLTLTVTAKLGDKTAFLVEVQQAGIFTIKGYNDQEKGVMAGAYCPNILFPYAREAISDIVSRSGFPQLLLAPINFDALYQQHMQDRAEGGKEPVTH
ncbi:MAG: protein-export chaperone SecB [Gammaproteobacteria bacterium]|nr:protein-export chaperone SecB [Gammaproteobacteria bacterium]